MKQAMFAGIVVSVYIILMGCTTIEETIAAVTPKEAYELKKDEVLCAFTAEPHILQNQYSSAKIMTPPTPQTKNETEVLWHNGVKSWTKHVLPTHKARKEELKVGGLVMFIAHKYSGSDAPEITLEEYRYNPWAFGRITDLSELYKGIVEINGYRMFFRWLRMPDVPVKEE
jgi:hypothetical protein